MTDDISKVVCHDCFGNGKKCLAGRNAHRTNWHDCETCAGTGHIERTAPSLSHADCQHADTRAGWDSVTCNVCGAFRADSGWGIAKGEWFKSRHEAEFYKKNGRRLESATTPAEVEAIGDVLYELETLESDVNGVADYTGRVRAHIATLARQLAEAKAESEETANNLNTMIVYWREAAEQAESALAEATRRLGEVEAYRDATFDGNAVYAALDDRAKARTSADNVADVLDALNRVARATGEGEGHD